MDTAVRRARPTATSIVRQALSHEWTPRLLIMLGAMFAFAILTKEYFEATPYYGRSQILGATAGVLIMLLGSAWEVLLARRSAVEALNFWAVAFFVTLIILAFAFYELENRAFYEFVGPLALFGFIINHHLPAPLRTPFFLFLSIVVIAGVFGANSVPAAIGLVAIGLTLIGICHLPIPMWARIAILMACTVGLAFVRVGWIYVGWMAAILPIVASMFMFRLPVYLYDISNGKGPKDAWGRLSYFFMFPNLVFPFFPVVDCATFGRTYYNEEATKIYERGATYLLRGLIHLILYRIVHVYFIIAPDEVSGAGSFLQFIISNFGLYLRISGLFHTIAGLILLFGYNLPETHARFYLSNSFIDFWRRINIYWKDFMQKMFFNPSYLQFKGWGMSHSTSVVLSIIVVFSATWVLHAYQWFWLSGTMLFTVPDILFWAILAVFLIAQTLLEDRPRKSGGPRRTVLSARAFLIVRTLCTFFFISLLWSMWTSHSIPDWLALVARSGLIPAFFGPAQAGPVEWLTTLASAALVLFTAAVTTGVSFGMAPSADKIRQTAPPWRPAFYTSVGLGSGIVCCVLALQIPVISSAISPRLHRIAEDIGKSKLNAVDIAMLDRGYYEGLAQGNRFNAELWEFFMNRPEGAADAPRGIGPGMQARDDYLEREFTPNSQATVADKTFSINRWGMYDQDYQLEKPEGTYRIAVIGASRPMGWGVSYEERFETLLENRLNMEQNGDGKIKKYEVLNFSVYGYHPIERLLVLAEKALPFRPDAVIYIAGLLDLKLDHHAQMIQRGVKMPYDFLDDINRRAGVDQSMSEAEIVRRLEPYRYDLVSNAYKRFGQEFRTHGMDGIWIHIPSISDRPTDVDETRKLADAAGFVTLDLTKIYDPAAFRLSRWDGHPSVKGHQFLADTIYNDLIDLQKKRRVDLGINVK